MKAIVVHEPGGPEVLKIEEVADPSPSGAQVVVKLEAIGINPVETYRRAGTPPYNTGPLPYTPGSDGAGVIVAVGPDSKWEVGARVFLGSPKIAGTYAEKVLCEDAYVHPLADNVSFAQGAAIGVPFATAHRALFGKAKAQKGEFVFIHGATGGVGVAAIQLAQRSGLKVGGSAGSSSGEEFLENLGVRYTTNHTQQGYMSDVLGMTCGAGCDIILEMVANVNLGKDPQVVAPFGRIVVIGNRGETTINPRDFMQKDATVYAMTLFNVSRAELGEIYADIATGLADGSLKPVVGKEFALEDAAEAHAAVMASGARGKIVLKP